jgi:hypothetical protein
MKELIVLLAAILILLLIFALTLRLLKKRKQASNLKSRASLNFKIKKTSNPKENLYSLNRLSREFFKHYLNLKSELTYLEIAKILRDKNKPHEAEYCEELESLLYSGREIKKEVVLKLIQQFIEMTHKANLEKSKENKNHNN